MNTAYQVDELIKELKQQLAAGQISLSEACWKVCLACLGWSYVYSAWGAECTPKERRYRFSKFPDKTTIKSKCKGFDSGDCSGCQWFPDDQRTRCYDCRGFVDWILKQFGFDLYGDIVSTQWGHGDNWCVKGQIGADPIPQNVLVNLFIKKNGKWTHTGFYFCGSTCECSVNVQYHEKMVKNRWTHWAIAKCFASGYQQPEQPTEPQKEPEKQPGKEQQTVNKTIRKGNMGELVKQCQTMLKQLGYDLGICGIDGDFGTATEKAVKAFQRDHGLAVDGVVGKNTWTALQQAVDAQQSSPPVVYYDVTILHLTSSEADAVVDKYPNSRKEIEKG